jgi:molybdopterin converting factor small subunit
MIKVKIKFYADLRERYCPNNQDGMIELLFDDNSKINDIFERLQIDDGEIGFVMLNEKKVQKDAILHDGDFVHILSFVAGG